MKRSFEQQNIVNRNYDKHKSFLRTLKHIYINKIKTARIKQTSGTQVTKVTMTLT